MRNIHKSKKALSAVQIAVMADQAQDISGQFTNKGKMMPAVRQVLRKKIARLNRNRFARECAKLDPNAEKTMADEGLSGKLKHQPKY